jgi:hypothetical protein
LDFKSLLWISEVFFAWISKIFSAWMIFWQLGIESRDFSQDEKERTACFHSKQQPRTVLSKNNCHLVNLLSLTSSSLFLSMIKIM